MFYNNRNGTTEKRAALTFPAAAAAAARPVLLAGRLELVLEFGVRLLQLLGAVVQLVALAGGDLLLALLDLLRALHQVLARLARHDAALLRGGNRGIRLVVTYACYSRGIKRLGEY